MMVVMLEVKMELKVGIKTRDRDTNDRGGGGGGLSHERGPKSDSTSFMYFICPQNFCYTAGLYRIHPV